MQLDRLDLAILDHLQSHGRATAQELSEAAGLSPSPSHRRQKMLEEAGVISRYVALLDQEKVGLPVNVFVTVKLESHTAEALRSFERAIEACPEVMEMYEMTGASDYLLRVVAADVAADAYSGGEVVRVRPGAEAGGLPDEPAAAVGRAIATTPLNRSRTVPGAPGCLGRGDRELSAMYVTHRLLVGLIHNTDRKG
jgi:Lrp/AsnC family leucine-responsive transcriptional regulator